MRRASGAPQPLSKTRLLLMGGALLLVVTFGAQGIGRLLFAPWSIGLGGRETLTGPWAGSLKTRHGAELGLFLELEYLERPGTSYRSGGGALGINNLKGRGTLCTPEGERYEYAVSGKADPTGWIEKLWLENGEASGGALDLQLTGAWRDGALLLTTIKNPYLPNGPLLTAQTSSPSAPVDPDDYLAPGSLTQRDPAAFEAACRRIRA